MQIIHDGCGHPAAGAWGKLCLKHMGVKIVTDTPSLTPSAQRPYPSLAMASYVVALLVIAILFAYVGRQVPTLFIDPIRAEFRVSDAEMGLLHGFALNLCFGLASLPLAFLIDRGNRIRLIWWMVVIWSSATALGGFSTEFWQLFACRMVVGIAEAGLVPATYSLLADLFSKEQQAKATLIYYAGSLVGASAGIALIGTGIRALTDNSAMLPDVFSNLSAWRLAFLAAGAVCIPLLVLLLFAREPHRQATEQEFTEIGTAESFPEFLAAHGARVMRKILGIVMMMVGVDAMLTWTPTILTRSYAVSAAEAGEWLGLLWGVGSIAGVALAGLLTSRFGGHLQIRNVVLTGACTSALVATTLFLVTSQDQYLVVLTIYFAAVFIGASTAPILISSLAPNHLRARVLALWVIVSAIMSAISPAVVGFLSDLWGDQADGLRLAMATVVVPCSALSILLLSVRDRAPVPALR